MKLIKAVRGMKDVLPEDAHIADHIEKICAKVLSEAAYCRIATPIVEKTELFSRTIGAETDIVAKEMYTFKDRNGDSLTLRPEGTASCVRSGIENGLFHNQQQRFWYSGAMFRHERPQKGRYRQFHQIGAEAYGWSTPDIDAELISLTQRFWEELGLSGIELQINSLGSSQSRSKYRDALVNYLDQYKEQLDSDSQRRLSSNPLRILDSKVESTQKILIEAPVLSDYLDDESKSDFEQLRCFLDSLKIEYTINQKLVRGLDYYNKMVFEWVSPNLGTQATICAGGRYDGLVEQLGGKPIPASGFAMGVERLIELVKENQNGDRTPLLKRPDVYFLSTDTDSRTVAFSLISQLRAAGICVQMHCGEGALKNQFKKANKSGAKYAFILGEDEMLNKQITIKPLLSGGEQIQVNQADLLTSFSTLLSN